MKLLETCVVHHNGEPRSLKLYSGNLAAIPPDEAVDLLVVSAFPNDYLPTPTSLIGALAGVDVSVAELAQNKEVDLRSTLACWLSKDLGQQHPDVGFRRILCFEPLSRGRPPELVGDLFRAIVPFALGDPPIRSIAMPLLAAGDQSFDPETMLRALFDAATHWLAYGLPVDTIKIVIYSDAEAERLRQSFAAMAAELGADRPPRLGAGVYRSARDVFCVAEFEATPRPGEPYDFFVSYSHEDGEEVKVLVETLTSVRPGLRIFQDKLELQVGDAWQAELDAALESCYRVIVVYSPAYLQSKMCMEEFNMARIRHRESEDGVILPIYLRSVKLPLYMRSLQYVDCREADVGLVRSACTDLAKHRFG